VTGGKDERRKREFIFYQEGEKKENFLFEKGTRRGVKGVTL